MNKPQGIFENGDLWFGERDEDEDGYWFGASLPTSDPDKGADYQTQEIPDTFPLFTMVRFNEGAPEAQVNAYFNSDFNTQYAMAKNIGDKRFGSECRHERSKRGYCPDCLRKVI